MLRSVRNLILKTSKSRGISIKEFSPDTTKTLINQVYKKYAFMNIPERTCLAQGFGVEHVYIHDEDSWEWVGNYVGNGKAVLFFIEQGATIAFEIESLNNIFCDIIVIIAFNSISIVLNYYIT